MDGKQGSMEVIGDFRSVDLPIMDRDIRDHDFAENDYNIAYTDSTNVFSVILSQFNDPTHDYAFVLNDPSRMVMKRLAGYQIVDPSLIGNHREIFMDEEKSRINAGDLVLMRRPMKYRVMDDRMDRERAKDRLKGVLGNTTGHGIRNIESPFTE